LLAADSCHVASTIFSGGIKTVQTPDTLLSLQAALGLTPLKRSHYTGAGFTPNTSAIGDLNAAG
jgi:hypothetical protein